MKVLWAYSLTCASTLIQSDDDDEDDDDIVDDDEPEELLQQFRDGTEMKIVILGTNEISLTQNRLNIKENPVFLL